jgi:cell division protein FtsI (penicillin-binding protein 3)
MTGRRGKSKSHHQAAQHHASPRTLWPIRRDVAPATGGRLALFAVLLGLGFVAVAAQLVHLGLATLPVTRLAITETPHAVSRPDIIDRRGRILASDINVYGVFADPVRLINADDAAESIAGVLKNADVNALREKLSNAHRKARGPEKAKTDAIKPDKVKHGFVWIARGLTPREAEAMHALGLPGSSIQPEPGRVYPAGSTASHILGQTNVDNQGLGGIEKFIDNTPLIVADASGLGGRPTVRLSIDLGAQHALEEELHAAMIDYKTQAALGLVLDARSGEVLAMASLPDYDPNHREQAQITGRQNRFLSDSYELGSVFKAFTIAMGLDYGVVTPHTKYDVMTPLHYGHRELRDKHAHNRYETVEEIFVHSSNTGAARIGLDVGGERQKAFLERMGLLKPLATEIGASAEPRAPKIWREINTATIAYGHGVSVPPLRFAAAAAALVNGGWLLDPTFLPRSRQDAKLMATRVLRPETSLAMRKMMRLNVENGTGKLAAAPGYDVGGKTGTAVKLADGRYGKEVLATFLAAFPMQDPQYIVMVTLDEPQPTEAAHKRTEAAWNAAPVAGAIIRRLAPMLGVPPMAQAPTLTPTAHQAAPAHPAAHPALAHPASAPQLPMNGVAAAVGGGHAMQ